MARPKRNLYCKRCGVPTLRPTIFCSRECWGLYCIEHMPDRFWTKVHKTETCWLWQGRRNAMGYGSFRIGNTMQLAHRVAWELTHGPIPDGLCCLHRCDTPPCCNPHRCLFLGTKADNRADMVAKGRERILRGDDAWQRRYPEKNRRGEQLSWTKTTAHDVREIRRLFAAGVTRADLMRQFGLHWGTIHAIVSRQTWKHVD